jgi:putative phage-type endonuclease
MNTDNRNQYLGGSDAAAVLGLSRWKTPLQVWAEKTGNIDPDDISKKLSVKLGNTLEQTVADLFCEETGKKVCRVNETKLHSKYPFLAANLDRRVVGEDSILECKTCSAWKSREWEGEEIPAEYIIQCMHYLAVTGKEKAYIAVLIGNQDFKWKEIKRDETVIAQMIEREVAFWEKFVIPQVMPMMISTNDTVILYKLFPIQTPQSEIVLTDEANRLCEEIEILKQDKKSIDGSIEQKSNILKAMLKENECGITSLYKIIWKAQHREAYQVEACNFRALRIKKITEG